MDEVNISGRYFSLAVTIFQFPPVMLCCWLQCLQWGRYCDAIIVPNIYLLVILQSVLMRRNGELDTLQVVGVTLVQITWLSPTGQGNTHAGHAVNIGARFTWKADRTNLIWEDEKISHCCIRKCLINGWYTSVKLAGIARSNLATARSWYATFL